MSARDSEDPAMSALSWLFEKDLAAFPAGGRLLLVNPAWASGPWTPDHATVWQWWKGHAARFEAHGFTVCSTALSENKHDSEQYDVVLLRVPRQTEEAHYAMSCAAAALKPGGSFVAAAENNAGGTRLEKDLSPFFSDLDVASKHKCRIVWGSARAAEIPDAWVSDGDMRFMPSLGTWTQPGLFSWNRLDPATTMLLASLPDGMKGRVADFGCGTGRIAAHLLAHNPGIETMLCFDADARAVEACRRTLTDEHPERTQEFLWADLSVPLKDIKPVDTVVMNPPFHAEKALAIELGRAFIANAATLLCPDGTLWMVANAHLPYEKELAAHFRTVEKVNETGGFKIFHARR